MKQVWKFSRETSEKWPWGSQLEKNTWIVLPWTNRGNAGGRGQAEGKSIGKGRLNLLLKMLNLRCVEDQSVKINAQQVGGNSELMLRGVVRPTVLDLLSLVILREMFFNSFAHQTKYFLTIFTFYPYYSSARVSRATFIPILHKRKLKLREVN